VDCSSAYGLRSVSLRYFNAAGADPDGEIGEAHDPRDPRYSASGICGPWAAGVPSLRCRLQDGSAVRNYIHVADLASAHAVALAYLIDGGATAAFNLGTGNGTSDFDIVRAVERVSGRTVLVVHSDRRPGDPPVLAADARLTHRA